MAESKSYSPDRHEPLQASCRHRTPRNSLLSSRQNPTIAVISTIFGADMVPTSPDGRCSMRAKITKRVVDSVDPKAATYLIRDADLKGFVLVVTPAGARSYAVDYRAGSGRGSPKRRLTIGKHGSPWTPETARIEAKRLLAEVAAGRDPATARREDRKALTFGELIDLYLSEGVSPQEGVDAQGRSRTHRTPPATTARQTSR